jgi:hypothetical protein
VSQPRVPRIQLQNGIVFLRPEERIREYCELEVYRDIGYKGGYDDRHNVSDTVSEEDIEAANNFHASLSMLERRRIMGNQAIPSILARIEDAALGELSVDEWKKAKELLQALLNEFLSIPIVTLAKATKVLHLKRPHLLPVLDSMVVKFLTGDDMEAMTYRQDEQLHLGLLCLEIASADIVANREGFDELRRRLSDLPTQLTVVRMYDILCRTQQKWVIEGNPITLRGTASRSLNQAEELAAEAPPEPSGDATAGDKPTISGEIKTTKEFRQIVGRAEGVIVITGTSPPRVHLPLCPLVTDDRFKENVVINQGKGGRYYWRETFAEARKEFGADPCRRCNPSGLVPARTGGAVPRKRWQ